MMLIPNYQVIWGLHLKIMNVDIMLSIFGMLLLVISGFGFYFQKFELVRSIKNAKRTLIRFMVLDVGLKLRMYNANIFYSKLHHTQYAAQRQGFNLKFSIWNWYVLIWNHLKWWEVCGFTFVCGTNDKNKASFLHQSSERLGEGKSCYLIKRFYMC